MKRAFDGSGAPSPAPAGAKASKPPSTYSAAAGSHGGGLSGNTSKLSLPSGAEPPVSLSKGNSNPPITNPPTSTSGGLDNIFSTVTKGLLPKNTSPEGVGEFLSGDIGKHFLPMLGSMSGPMAIPALSWVQQALSGDTTKWQTLTQGPGKTAMYKKAQEPQGQQQPNMMLQILKGMLPYWGADMTLSRYLTPLLARGVPGGEAVNAAFSKIGPMFGGRILGSALGTTSKVLGGLYGTPLSLGMEIKDIADRGWHKGWDLERHRKDLNEFPKAVGATGWGRSALQGLGAFSTPIQSGSLIGKDIHELSGTSPGSLHHTLSQHSSLPHPSQNPQGSMRTAIEQKMRGGVDLTPGEKSDWKSIQRGGTSPSTSREFVNALFGT